MLGLSRSLLLVVSFGACAAWTACDDGLASPTTLSDYSPPRAILALDGYFHYVDAPVWRSDALGDRTFSQDTPEGAVLAFYTNRMRGDEPAWQAALAPRDVGSPFVDIVLDFYERLEVLGIQLVAKRGDRDAYVEVVIWLDYLRDEVPLSEEAVVVVQEVDGTFYVRTPATGVEPHWRN